MDGELKKAVDEVESERKKAAALSDELADEAGRVVAFAKRGGK